jgi:hypothetical protein
MSTGEASSPPRTADDFLPGSDSGSRTSLVIEAAPEAVWRGLHSFTLRDMPATAVLLAVRSLPALVGRRSGGSSDLLGRPMLELMTGTRFVVLHETPGELLTLGLIGQPWKLDGGDDVEVDGPEAFVAFADPGYVKVAFDFRFEPCSVGTLLTTVTTNAATDADSARRFSRYWRLIGPGSKLIRLDMLRAIRRRSVA